MMVLRVVGDGHHATFARCGDAPKLLHEREERCRVEHVFLSAEDELAIAKTDSPEETHGLPGGVVQNDGVLVLGGYPHAAEEYFRSADILVCRLR